MTTISPALSNFFAVELRNEESMRREYGGPGTDEYEVASHDPDDDLFIPESSLATALGSWEQADDEIRAAWLRVPIAAVPTYGDELRALLAREGENTLLEDLLAKEGSA